MNKEFFKDVNWKAVGTKVLKIVGGVFLTGLAAYATGKSDTGFSLGSLLTSSKPNNPVEEAIDSLKNSALKVWSDSSKQGIAKQIYALTKQDDVSDDTKAYAIRAINDISDSLWSDSSKKNLTNYIVGISTTKGADKQ